MQFISAVFAAIALAAPAFAAPTAPTHAVQKFQGATTGRYIVKLKDGVAKSAVFGTKKVKLTHDWTLLNGFASDFDAATLESLRTNPNVEYIAEDGIMHITATQNNAPWGLARLSSASKLTNQDTSALTYSYTYDDSAGSDTGVLTTHSQFGGRARWGATFGGYADADGHGHGTHCACVTVIAPVFVMLILAFTTSGTAAGSQYGVAKAANIIAVKVLSDIGSGSVADIVSGFDWIASSVKSSGRPSIVSMSFGGDVSVPLDNAVASLTAAGIHAVVSSVQDSAEI
ncbi:hypothetical protein H0H81_004981 [Sphagnurus paluster]|uniref:Uncharacterized protein n=1 Tax=Sphagnurus paluster TaxID=117069 RepID=A0A9P7FRG4_9AGAR|nr:hypothetical protein H0H81_004981 [Sphagnurus paluster]